MATPKVGKLPAPERSWDAARRRFTVEAVRADTLASIRDHQRTGRYVGLSPGGTRQPYPQIRSEPSAAVPRGWRSAMSLASMAWRSSVSRKNRSSRWLAFVDLSTAALILQFVDWPPA
jgi:hypothetical protein